MNGRSPKRMGNRSHWYAPQGCYRCAGDDNWLVITVRDDAEWAALCKATGPPRVGERQALRRRRSRAASTTTRSTR